MIHPDTFNNVEFSGSKGLVYIGDKIIVYRRDNKTDSFPLCLDLPGGGSEKGESPFETFKREIKEEFGIEIKREDIIASFRQNSLLNIGTKTFFIVAKTKFNEKDIIFGNEGLEWILMTVGEFIKRSDSIEKLQNRVNEYMQRIMVSE